MRATRDQPLPGIAAGSFHWLAWLAFWATQDLEEIEREQWSRVMYACRYARSTPLSEWLDLETRDLARALEALAAIVKDENEQSSSGQQ